MQPLRQLGERFLADAVENLGLIAEIKINRAGGVLDLLGDLPDGDVLVAFFDEQRACRVEDLLAYVFLLPRSPLLYAHDQPNEY